MEILKHGNRYNVEFTGMCPYCGCEFRASRSEVSGISSPIFCSGDSKSVHYYVCDCPECGLMTAAFPSSMRQSDIENNETGNKQVVEKNNETNTDNNGFMCCTRIETAPNIPENVLKENMITPKEVMNAYMEIERRRYEDNLPWWRRLFRKLFSIAFILIALASMYSCEHVVYDTFGVVKSVSRAGNGSYKYSVKIVNLDRDAIDIDFRTDILYQVGDTIVIGKLQNNKVVTNDTLE